MARSRAELGDHSHHHTASTVHTCCWPRLSPASHTRSVPPRRPRNRSGSCVYRYTQRVFLSCVCYGSRSRRGNAPGPRCYTSVTEGADEVCLLMAPCIVGKSIAELYSVPCQVISVRPRVPCLGTQGLPVPLANRIHADPWYMSTSCLDPRHA